jgi:predicted ATP-grasp superfamily ATP-dependent carboligase
LIVKSANDFPMHDDRIAASLPVIAQEFIPGDDGAIRFGALYLDQGRILARFEGRKLRSRPMGHTTLAVSEPNDDIHRVTVCFFEGLALSGPVSLELKQAPDGSLWVIEPTVGRTDFWVGLCIANGVNLPLIEYRSQSGLPVPATRQARNYLWMNGERDPFAPLWLALHQPGRLFSQRIMALYLDLSDIRPFIDAVSNFIRSLLSRIFHKAVRQLTRTSWGKP